MDRTMIGLEAAMSDTTPHAPTRKRPHTPPTTNAFLEFDVMAEIERLHDETTWNTGHNARTLIKYDDFRVVLIALKAGARIPEHTAHGRISLYALSGHIRLNAAGRTFDLRAGSLVALDSDVPHELEPLQESAILLSIAWPDVSRSPSTTSKPGRSSRTRV
jgi:quercetin dioxygenase-like cupin family protein